MLAPKSAGNSFRSRAPGEPSIDVEGRTADAVLATQVRCPQPGLLLLQYRDDLFFVEPAALHASALCCGGLYQNLEEI